MGAPATFTRGRLTKRMEAEGFNDVAHATTLMEFREHAGHAMGVTDKHMDRFVNRYVIDFPRPFSMETKGTTVLRFSIKEKLGQIREKYSLALKEYWERLESLDEAGFSKEDQYDWYLWKA
ncbi:hypothetical protein H4Q26_010235 [Puccinia striiformis f. sp. tritici PST-130]|nr:hypothetical protein H4Q26_010235 [Puccinia striiformis f. sp. tritici PST-130]